MNIPFVNINETKIPVVPVSFKTDKGGCEAYMIIDTGASTCVLSSIALEYISSDTLIEKENKDKIIDSNGVEVINQCYKFTFKLGGEKFSESFSVIDPTAISHVTELPLLGIIGFNFLVKHGLVVDFENDCLRSSEDIINRDIESFRFIYLLESLFNQYSLPIIELVGEKDSVLMMVDSGADVTSITLHALRESGIPFEETGKKSYAMGGNGTTKICNHYELKFTIPSLPVPNEMGNSYSNEVQVVNNDENKYLLDNIIDENGILQKPISGLLSTKFMRDQKWNIDFGNMLIYSNVSDN